MHNEDLCKTIKFDITKTKVYHSKGFLEKSNNFTPSAPFTVTMIVEYFSSKWPCFSFV
jgi:hypothetical protein